MSPTVPAADRRLAEATAAAEAHLHARNRLLRVLDRVGDGVVVVDAEGVRVFRNEAAARFVGARHSEALVERAIGQLLWRALGGETVSRELELFGPPRAVVEVRAVPLDDADGRRLGAAAFVADVSEARRVESVRRDFVANVSHELKTPIGALALLAEAMAMSDDAETSRRLADQVLREADRLARIVDDLLDLSLIEAQETPVRHSVAAVELVQEAVDRVRAAAEVTGVPVSVGESDPSAAVSCDPRQVVSALANLLDNAVKYSEPGGEVEVSVTANGDRVVFTVRDHGIGIPSRDLERIFERFYRVDRARSRKTGGTGLGLSIVRHVVQAHGGEVMVDSREGEGSTFQLLFPKD
ncbi:MAG: ATP-binding protein [Acidimicrobiia bacterium]